MGFRTATALSVTVSVSVRVMVFEVLGQFSVYARAEASVFVFA